MIGSPPCTFRSGIDLSLLSRLTNWTAVRTTQPSQRSTERLSNWGLHHSTAQMSSNSITRNGMIGKDGLNLSGVFFCWSSNIITGYPFENVAPGPLGWSPHGGKMDPLPREEAGKPQQTQTYCMGLLWMSGWNGRGLTTVRVDPVLNFHCWCSS